MTLYLSLMIYVALISFALGIVAGALIALNNKSKADAAKDKGKELLDALKGK